jgi:ribonuclease G
MGNNIDFFIKQTSFFSLAYIVIDKKLSYVFSHNSAQLNVGDIYLATITSKQANIGVFFVKINNHTNTMLEINDHNKHLPLGAKILVQIKKEAMGEKLAVVSQDIVMLGLLANYKPTLLKNNFHKNIDEEQKNQINEIVKNGVIVKTSYNYNLFSQLLLEVETLKNLYNDILKQKEVGLLYKYSFLSGILFKNPQLIPSNIFYTNANTLQSINDLKENYNFLKFTVKYLMHKEVEFLNEELATYLHTNFIVNDNINLHFTISNHFNYIDVNYSGGDNLANKKEEAIKKANISALPDIVNHILLRNLSGQILVDLLKLSNKSYKNHILEAIKKLFKNDALKTHILGFSNLGILEISRQKQGEALDFILNDDKFICFNLINLIYLKLQQNKSEITLQCNQIFYNTFIILAKGEIEEIKEKYKLLVSFDINEAYTNPNIK